MRSAPDVQDYDSLPLIPLPSSGTHSSDFDIFGRPFGCLNRVISTQRTTDSMVPFLPTSSVTPLIQWIHQQILLSKCAPSHTLDLVSEITLNFS